MKKIRLQLILLTVTLFVFSCKKSDTGSGVIIDPVDPPVQTSGLYVLNEGTFGNNNTMLTFYDFDQKTPVTDFYAQVNGNGLGDTGNDMIIYGGKMYIAMNVSSYLEIADAATAKNIKKIELKNTDSQPLQPRSITSYKNFVMLSCWDGSIQVIDTASLNIVNTIKVGSNPEGIAVSGDKLYVANSGGLNFPNYDSTVSVINLTTFEEIRKIKVGLNPSTVVADQSGNVYVGFIGNYGDVQGGLVKINTQSDEVTAKVNIESGKMAFVDGKLYVEAGAFGDRRIQVLNPEDLSVFEENFITDGTQIVSPYALNIDKTTGDVYVGDQMDFVSPGAVYCFDKEGKKKFSFSTAPGVGPNSIAFLQQPE